MKFLKVLSFIIFACTCFYSCTPLKTSEEVAQETYIHKYGVTIPKKDWIKRGSDGQVVLQFTNGSVATKNYDNGILQGETTYTFPLSETFEKIEVYSNNNLISETLNYLSGAPQKTTNILSPTDKEVSTWYESGSPKSVEILHGNRLFSGQYFNLKNEIESQVVEGTGISTERNGYGNIVSRNEIRAGFVKLETIFYNNGDPKIVTEYSKDGKINGTRQFFFIGGVPQRSEEWINGEQHGTTIVFHNGEKQKEIPYLHGVVEGVETRFREGGEIAEEISWRNGLRHGPSHFYTGKEIKTDLYYNDNLVKDVVSRVILGEVYN